MNKLLFIKYNFPSIALTLFVLYSIYIFNNRFNEMCLHKYEKLKKKKKIDTLNVNYLLSFGIIEEMCDKHKTKIYDCGDLNCNYGKLGFLINFIKNSKKNLDICIYIFTEKQIGEAIIEAYDRGVKVRVITDADKSFSTSSYIQKFYEKDIPLRKKFSKFIMHHKFILVDAQILINGSMNFTPTGAFCNIENVMITSQPQLVTKFEMCFNDLWNNFESK